MEEDVVGGGSEGEVREMEERGLLWRRPWRCPWGGVREQRPWEVLRQVLGGRGRGLR